jgi:CDP-glycerol glycerophosphotransferase (TagB/SpsB family)
MFDLYCTQGPDTTIPFRKLAERHGYFRVAETGWSKMDPLFAHTNGDAVPRRPRPVVLYTSTFNERLSSTGALFEEIRAQIARGPWDWILTLHPKSPGSVKQRYRALECERAVYVEGDDVAPLLMQADAMLSDTSSIVSEFLLLHKPVVTFRNRAPGPQLLDVGQPSEVMAALVRAISRPPELIEAIRGYAARIHPYRDGRSSHRVLDAVESFLREGQAGLRRKPLNLFRKLRSRRELGYYRIR